MEGQCEIAEPAGEHHEEDENLHEHQPAAAFGPPAAVVHSAVVYGAHCFSLQQQEGRVG